MRRATCGARGTMRQAAPCDGCGKFLRRLRSFSLSVLFALAPRSLCVAWRRPLAKGLILAGARASGAATAGSRLTTPCARSRGEGSTPHTRSPEVTLADPRANGACVGPRQHATFVLWAWRRRRAWTVRVPSAVGSGWGQTSSEPSRSYANSTHKVTCFTVHNSYKSGWPGAREK